MKKFEKVIDINDWDIETDSGWKSIKKIFKTEKYDLYEVNFYDTRFDFFCADEHIVFDKNFEEVHVKNLKSGDLIHTKYGLKQIKSVKKLNIKENMFDFEIEGEDHRYYANDVLHHNTTCCASYMLWRAMFKKDQTILVVAHNLNQALEITGRIRFSYEELPFFIKPGVLEYNKGSIVFDNGSRIISRAASVNAARGLSISLLYMDELSFIRKKMQEEFWASVSPTLATGGDCIITSTPGSDEDLFALLWRQAEDCYDIEGNLNPGGVGKNGFKAFKATWRDHPERDEEWAKKEKAKIGEAKFEREFNCNFISHTETLIDQIFLSNMEGIEPIFQTGQVRWYKKIDPEKIYVVSLDPSMGTGSDPAAIEVFSIPDLEQVAEWRSNVHPIRFQIQLLLSILQYIDTEIKNRNKSNDFNIYWTIENNTLGEAALSVIEDFGEENFPGIFVSEPVKRGNMRRFRKGLNTTMKTKIFACSKLKSLIERNKMKIYSKHLIRELKYFENSGMTYKAKQGETDDLVMATLLCIRIVDIISSWEEKIEDIMKEKITDDGDENSEPLPFILVKK
ncbi:MAG: terminase family protein [Candidatus Dojkabacteria bacterium]|nr:terminase family protein [Candidatus Dojkabacteria bacterium]